MFSTLPASRGPGLRRDDDGASREDLIKLNSTFVHVLSDIFRLIQCVSQAYQLHELAAVTVFILSPGLTGQVFDFVVAEVFEVCAWISFDTESLGNL